MKTLRMAAALVCVLVPVLRASGQDAGRWYELWLGDARAGWSHETTTTSGDRVTTRSEMEMSIGRANEAVTVRTAWEFVETVDGEPVEAWVSQTLAQSPTEVRYVFDGDEVVVINERGGERQETRVAAPSGDWLPPAAAGRFVAARLAGGADSITLRTIDPSNGLSVVSVKRTGIERAEVEVLGERVECFRAESVMDVAGTKVRAEEWMTEEGDLLRSETAMGALRMTMVASTEARARREAEVAEVMVSTFVRPDRRIENPRWLGRAVYRVAVREGELPELPGSAYQAVEMLGDGAARVTVDLSGSRAAGEVDREGLLAATTFADHEDPAIVELTERAIAGKRGGAAQAEALRRLVFRHIEDKNLGTAFATASQTVRSGAGDCSEHGVLLAAMLRAAGIPSRVAVGVVYVERFAGEREVFGYHMWTQALLETEGGEAWVDLDATLDARTAFDATHIALATSELGEQDAVSSLAGIAPLLGTLEISVESVE